MSNAKPTEAIDASDYVAVDASSSLFPGDPHRATVWRWITHGIRGVRLRTAMVGGRRFTTHQWAQEFLDECAANDRLALPQPVITPARRQSQARAAMATLKTMGVGSGN